jgi:hypothetical protein
MGSGPDRVKPKTTHILIFVEMFRKALVIRSFVLTITGKNFILLQRMLLGV